MMVGAPGRDMGSTRSTRAVQTGVGSTFQGAEVSDQGLDIGVVEFCAEPGHFTFDALSNDFCDSGIAFFQVVKARSFVATRVIAMAMGAIVIE